MQHSIDYIPNNHTKRWIAYFDLLGIKCLIQSQNWADVLNALTRAVGELKDQDSRTKNISVAWFSDTFILYSDDDSLDSFNAVASSSCLFYSYLLETFTPLTGAIACDFFYADHDNSIYFGEGLVEAHEYSEAQNWIGFILCPSAKKHLDEQDELLSNYGFVPTNIPYKDTAKNCRQGLLACMLGMWTEDGLKAIITNLKRMRKKNDDPKVDQKYKNSITFFEKFIDR